MDSEQRELARRAGDGDVGACTRLLGLLTRDATPLALHLERVDPRREKSPKIPDDPKLYLAFHEEAGWQLCQLRGGQWSTTLGSWLNPKNLVRVWRLPDPELIP